MFDGDLLQEASLERSVDHAAAGLGPVHEFPRFPDAQAVVRPPRRHQPGSKVPPGRGPSPPAPLGHNGAMGVRVVIVDLSGAIVDEGFGAVALEQILDALGVPGPDEFRGESLVARLGGAAGEPLHGAGGGGRPPRRRRSDGAPSCPRSRPSGAGASRW